MQKRLTITDVVRKKSRQEMIVMLTAYDYYFASLLDQAGVDMILVGDSLGNVFSGFDTTLAVSLEQMIYHTQTVVRAVRRSLVVADMPFGSYQASDEQAKANACLLMQKGGAQAVKLEVNVGTLSAVKAICEIDIPVMGHLGFTPQSVHQFGGYRIQGKTAAARQELIETARVLESYGCFAIVLEMVPADLAAQMRDALSIPVIGIGAGVNCDGQVLVTQDILGMSIDDRKKSFVKEYAPVGTLISQAILQFKKDVMALEFPDRDHSF